MSPSFWCLSLRFRCNMRGEAPRVLSKGDPPAGETSPYQSNFKLNWSSLDGPTVVIFPKLVSAMLLSGLRNCA